MERSQKIMFRTLDGYVLLRPNEIEYIKSDDSYSYVFEGENKFFVKDSLKSIELDIANQIFFRCHKSFIINLNKVRKIIKSPDYSLVMECGASIPVSRRLKSNVMELLFNQKFLKGKKNN